jgi:hypothetical protein
MSFKKEKQEKHIYFPERTLTIFSGEGRWIFLNYEFNKISFISLIF